MTAGQDVASRVKDRIAVRICVRPHHERADAFGVS